MSVKRCESRSIDPREILVLRREVDCVSCANKCVGVFIQAILFASIGVMSLTFLGLVSGNEFLGKRSVGLVVGSFGLAHVAVKSYEVLSKSILVYLSKRVNDVLKIQKY